MDVIKKLAVEGWMPLLYVEDSENSERCEEAPDDVTLDDPRVVRAEMWFIAGEQYLLTGRKSATDSWSTEEIGEYETDEKGRVQMHSGALIYELEELLPLVKRALSRSVSVPRSSVHPVLLALL